MKAKHTLGRLTIYKRKNLTAIEPIEYSPNKFFRGAIMKIKKGIKLTNPKPVSCINK